VDVWSLGIILYIMLSGVQPFNDDDTHKMYDDIMYGRYSFPDRYWSSISEGAKDLISKLLTVNPSQRITTVDALKHPWINVNIRKRKAETDPSLNTGEENDPDIVGYENISPNEGRSKISSTTVASFSPNQPTTNVTLKAKHLSFQ